MINIISGATRKPVSSDRLSAFFRANPRYNGTLYIGYPIIGTPDGPFPVDALWVSPDIGIVIFNLIEGRSSDGYEDAQDDAFNKLEAKLKNNRSLVQGRSLKVDVNVVTYGPVTAPRNDEIHPLCNDDSLGAWIAGFEPDARNGASYNAVLSVLQSISSIRKARKRREASRDNSLGAMLKSLEDSIANLDSLQSQAVIKTVEGVQRIRGLAGSGKTIVLALKAAYLHAQHPDWKIAVTFNTRSLKGQLRRLINTFVVEQTGEEPDWDKISVINAWGAPGGGERNGIYFSYCQVNRVDFYDFKTAQQVFGRGAEFASVCEKALRESTSPVSVYDAILVDEAQDLAPPFLRMCFQLLGKEKRLVYAYDELQNLSGESLPSPEEIFGKDVHGQPLVVFQNEAQDIMLEKCYRNSRPVLVTAHALGFGIYRQPQAGMSTGLIQMFDRADLWTEVGYSVLEGELADGRDVVLGRSEQSSPRFLEGAATAAPLLEFNIFDSDQHQSEWLAEQIRLNLSEGELEPSDIVVINPDPLSTRANVGLIRKLLFEAGINSHLAGVDTSPDVFFDADGRSVAFTGIHRAKGNEAGMVYIINAQDCLTSFGNLARVRNRLFTAITRSKAWVRVLGYGPRMDALLAEYRSVWQSDFKLRFRYPTEDERKLLNIVNRDMTADEKKKVEKSKDTLASLLEDIEAGRVFIEDLPAEQVKKLRALFAGT
jgi:superfamily I DNA and RNA helicase